MRIKFFWRDDNLLLYSWMVYAKIIMDALFLECKEPTSNPASYISDAFTFEKRMDYGGNLPC